MTAKNKSSRVSKSYVDQLADRLAAATSDSELVELEQLLNDARWMVPSLGDVAGFFGVQLQTVKEWRTGPNKMPGAEGAWNLQLIAQWRCERLRATSGNVRSTRQRELDEQAQEIDVQRKRTKLRSEQGELISRDAAAQQIASMFNEARVQIEQIPKIAGASVNPDIRTDVVHEWEQQIALVLKRLAARANEIDLQS